MLPFLLISLLLATAAPAAAQEFTLLGGMIHKIDPKGDSYGGQIDYRQHATENIALSVAYLNEGHLPGDRQDGYLAQMWGVAPLAGRQLSLAAGIGPYLYFNTTACPPSHCNDHGVGIIGSAGLSFETDGGILVSLRSNWVGTDHSDTVSAMLGVGYRFTEPPPGLGTRRAFVHRAHEITLYAGQTTVNSLGSEHAPAFSVEYRRHLFRYLDLTASWLHEGDAGILRRSGVTAQAWLLQPLLNDTLSIGIGGGAYLAADHAARNTRSQRLSAIATLTASFRMTDHWSARASWHRVITTYDSDTDVIMGGIGYLF